MRTPEDYFLGAVYFALAGLFWYLMRRFDNYVKPIQPLPKISANPKPKHAGNWRTRLIELSIVVFIIGLIYGIPEYIGRKDATEVCDSIPVGKKFSIEINELNAYRKDQKEKHGTLFAANYFPKIKGVEDGNGAIILVFLAGFPFSRAYCVLHLNAGVVESKRLMFNAEDYEYCDGEIRGVWECSEVRKK